MAAGFSRCVLRGWKAQNRVRTEVQTVEPTLGIGVRLRGQRERQVRVEWPVTTVESLGAMGRF